MLLVCFYLYCVVSDAMFLYVFFFKQKTAYEMRISDWSSDVCSSDLPLSQRLDEKIHVALRGSGRDGDVMKSFDAFGQLHHDRSPLFSAIADRLFKPAQRSLLQPV